MRLEIHRRTLIATAAGSFFVRPFVADAQDIQLTGAGSSFVGGVMRRWIEKAPAAIGMAIKYDAVGSGNGRNRVLAGEVDFGASDEPMEDALLTQGNLIQFPMVFGGITCAVNLPGIATEQLVLNGALLAGMYSGGIKKWDDPRIAALNSGVTLPDLDIHPVFQATPNGPPSGTTFAFTQYLLATNPAWREKFGSAITKRWAVGSMVATTDFMVETLKVLPGGIGYMPIGNAIKNGLSTVRLTNKAGKAVAASPATLAASVAAVDWSKPANLVPTLIDLPGEAAWPIVVATFVLIPRVSHDPARGAALRAFMKYIVTEGGDSATQNQAAALPKAAHAPVLSLLEQLHS